MSSRRKLAEIELPEQDEELYGNLLKKIAMLSKSYRDVIIKIDFRNWRAFDDKTLKNRLYEPQKWILLWNALMEWEKYNKFHENILKKAYFNKPALFTSLINVI